MVHVEEGEGDFGVCGARKKQDGSSHVATELGSSNNDVVLELWTGMLAEFLRVYPSAVGSLHSKTDIKLSLPKCTKTE